MIRPSTPDDKIALIAIADAIGFQPNELDQLSEMLADYFGGDSDSAAPPTPPTPRSPSAHPSAAVDPKRKRKGLFGRG